MLGGVDRVALGQEHHAGRQTDALGASGDKGQPDERVRDREGGWEEGFSGLGTGIAIHRLVEEDDVLAEVDLGEAQVLGLLRHVPEHHRCDRGVGHRQVQSQFQRLSPFDEGRRPSSQ